MKKIITITLALGLSSLLMAEANIPADHKAMNAKMTETAGETSKSSHEMAELVPLPHFKRLLAANKEVLKLTKEQNEKIKTQIFKPIRTKVHEGIKKAEQLEVKITNAVLKEKKTKEDLKADIEALIDIKREITNGHIDAVNTLAKILTKEQYQQLLEIIATKAQKH